MDLVLYNYFRSSTSYRVRIALHLKNLDFEYKAVPLLENAQHSATYLALNPQGEVPTLIHKDKVLAQSLPILEYLDEVFPTPRLYPTDASTRGVVRQFCENINSFLHPLTNLKVQQYLESQFGVDQKGKEAWAQYWYKKGLSTLETMLQVHAQTYCFGEQVTAADLCLIPVLFSARRFNVPLEDYPTLLRVEKSCLSLPAFEKAHPRNQPDSPSV